MREEEVREIGLLRNPVREYAWGSRTAIPELLGEPASLAPQAELWMGAHPLAPSLVRYEGRWAPLPELIARFPEQILGEETAKKYGSRLPYLFKVLAAASPLSLQAHPDREQASRGFAEENRRGLALDSPLRSYRDSNHKPECLCALTPFQALSGFRRVPEILSLMEGVCLPTLEREISTLRGRQDGEGLEEFFTALMTLDARRRGRLVEDAILKAEEVRQANEAFDWVVRLGAEFPGDIGSLSPLMLNLLCLRPGEAVYLPPGCLHSYLGGVGIELMANSDNVLRGGLTSKHVDLPELLNILRFTGEEVRPISPRGAGPAAGVYPTPAEEFSLSAIVVESGKAGAEFVARSAEIILCTKGEATLTAAVGGGVRMERGCSALVPAAAGRYRVEGNASLYRASVPVRGGDGAVR